MSRLNGPAWWSILLLVGFWGGAAPRVGAQQPPPDSTLLPPIVVTATRVPTPRDRLSNRVTVLSGDELRAAGVATVAQALAGLAGLSVVQTGSWGANTAVYVRGGESDYLKVLVDGVPVNEPGGAYDFAQLSVQGVDRIEVVRGPASVLYGSDAVAGVVQIFTRRQGPAVEAGVVAGTFNTVVADASATAGSAQASVTLDARWFRSDGAYAFNNAFDDKAFVGRAQLQPDDRTSVAVALRTTDAEFHYPTDGAGNLVDRNQRQLTSVTTIGLEITRRLSPALEGRLSLASNAIGGGLDDPPDDAGDTLGAFAFRSQRALDRRSAEGRLLWTAHRWLAVTAGAAFEQQRDRSQTVSQSEFGDFLSATDEDRVNWAGFVQVGTEGGPLAATAGARFDANERFGRFVTYRVGASWRLPGTLRAYGSLGSAFKEPTFFEQVGGSFVTGNPTLRPERATSWEVGLEQTALAGHLRFSTSLFGQRFRDLIQFTFTPPTPADPNYVNLAAASADGAEVEVEAVAAPGVRVAASYTYLRTEVTDAGVLPDDDAAFRAGDRLLRRPAHSLSVRAHAHVGRGGLSAKVRWVGSRADADFGTFPARRVELPAYAVVDLAAALTVLRTTGRRPGVLLTARVENLLDASYAEAFGFPARGRTVLVGGRMRM